MENSNKNRFDEQPTWEETFNYFSELTEKYGVQVILTLTAAVAVYMTIYHFFF